MDWLARIVRKLRLLASREKFNRELQEEMTFHRDQRERELIANGVPADEAHFAARRQFGNDTLLRDDSTRITGSARCVCQSNGSPARGVTVRQCFAPFCCMPGYQERTARIRDLTLAAL
jgi:hypothetical protein